MTEFVTAVNSRGEKQRIPAHWLDHPVLAKGFRLPPSALAEPSMSWTREELDAHASALGVDPAPYATKADLLSAIETTLPDQGEDETPAAGDNHQS